MKSLDGFLLHDLFKTFLKCEIGFVIDDIQSYNKVLASVRMRCYDMILAMEQHGVHAELYKPFKHYDVVIFTKTRKDSAVKLAEKLKRSGTIVVSDNFCEYLIDENRTDDWERKNILQILYYSDFAITYSKEQWKQFKKYHDKVYFINESVNDRYFRVCKEHSKDSPVTLIYSGYKSNALYLSLIAEVILQLQQEFGCKVICICEDDPNIKDFPYEFIQYRQKEITTCLLQGDIMLAPRPMEGIEKMQHTLTKIVSPMAIGLPVVASPIPSYIGTPAILCSSNEEWYYSLRKLITDTKKRAELGKESREYVRQNLSVDVIVQEYLTLINQFRDKKDED